MKAIFPYLGNFILPKKDIVKLKQIYNDNSNENFNDACISENHNFNYFKDNSFFIYDQTTRASISELKSALGIGTPIHSPTPPTPKVKTQNIQKIEETEKQLDDDDILSNSFFTTLKML